MPKLSRPCFDVVSLEAELLSLLTLAPACKRPLLASNGRQMCLDLATVPPLFVERRTLRVRSLDALHPLERHWCDGMVLNVWVRISSASTLAAVLMNSMVSTKEACCLLSKPTVVHCVRVCVRVRLLSILPHNTCQAETVCPSCPTATANAMWNLSMEISQVYCENFDNATVQGRAQLDDFNSGDTDE